MTGPIEAFPLCWPDGWPRVPSFKRNGSAYQVDFTKARDHLANELRLSRGRDVVISSNVPVRRDGLPLANMRQPDDPGVAVYWTGLRKGKPEPRVIACDCWRTVRENLRAVGLAVEAFRMLERTGTSEILDRAYTGFALLPESSDHWSVLGLARGTQRDVIDARYRSLAREHHPDRGGDPAIMASINTAYARAIAEVA